MKKFTGRYTTNTAKALKGSERILCQVSEDGTIYVCNGFLLCTMNAPEYAATVQPLTCCEPGAWTFDKDGKHEDEAHKLDLVKLFADTVRTAADDQHDRPDGLPRKGGMTVPIRESKRRNNDAYNAKCDYISLRPQKAVGYAIRAAAKATGQSIQAYVLQACTERMTREGQPLTLDPPADNK